MLYIVKNIAKKIKYLNPKYNLYIAGGFPRDYVLSGLSSFNEFISFRIKSKLKLDFDLVLENVTDDEFEDILKILAEEYKTSYTIYKQYKTAQIKISNLEYEFVLSRKETYIRYSRKPQTEIGTIYDDNIRRDFVCNALLINALTGEFVDFQGALNDINNKIIRKTSSDDRWIKDDPLRAMRAIRFAAQLNFKIENLTLLDIKNNAQEIRTISAERIYTELKKSLKFDFEKTIGLLYDTNLLKFVLPELSALNTDNGKKTKNTYFHTLHVTKRFIATYKQLFEYNEIEYFGVLLGSLFHDSGKQAAYNNPNKTTTFENHERFSVKILNSFDIKSKRIFDEKSIKIAKLIAFKHEHAKQLISRKILFDLKRIYKIPDAVINSNGYKKRFETAPTEVTDSAYRRFVAECMIDNEYYHNIVLLFCAYDISNTDKFLNLIQQNLYATINDICDRVISHDKEKSFRTEIDGNDIMEALNLQPSKTIGILLNKLKELVIDGEVKNEKEVLLNKVKELYENLD